MKRLFPLVNIVLITAISFLSVDIAYKMFAARLDPVNWHKPNIPKITQNLPQFKTPPLSKYKAIVERDIFQTNTGSDATTPEEMIVENIKPTERNLKLWGTVAANDPARAYAIIEEPGKKRRQSNQHLYTHGDTVQGAIIKKIMREKVILSVSGENEILHIIDPQSSGKFRRIRNVSNRQRKQPVRQKRVLKSAQQYRYPHVTGEYPPAPRWL